MAFYRSGKKVNVKAMAFSLAIIILSSVFMIFIVYSTFKINAREQKITSQISELKSQIRELEEKKDAVESVGGSDFDNYFLEKEARLRFNMKKPGEKVITVIRDEAENQEKPKTPWWNIFKR